jgi:hypothetical protein
LAGIASASACVPAIFAASAAGPGTPAEVPGEGSGPVDGPDIVLITEPVIPAGVSFLADPFFCDDFAVAAGFLVAITLPVIVHRTSTDCRAVTVKATLRVGNRYAQQQ